MINGWEHDLPDDDTLLRQWVLTNLTRARTFVERVDGRMDVWDAAALFDTGSPVMLDNAVILRRPVTATELDELIDTAHVFFPAGRSWLLMSVWPLPDLSAAGLQLMGHPPFMVRPPTPDYQPTNPPGLEIRRITPDEAATFATTLETGFGLPGASNSAWADPRVHADDLHAFLGLLDGEPVGTAAAFMAHGVTEVDMVSCLEGCRGKGIGEALTWAATLADPNRPAMLMSSDLGRPIYQRMGYLPVMRMTLWFVSG